MFEDLIKRVKHIYEYYDAIKCSPNMRELVELLVDCAQATPNSIFYRDVIRKNIYPGVCSLTRLELNLLEENGVCVPTKDYKDSMVEFTEGCLDGVITGRYFTEEQREYALLVTGVYNFIKQERIPHPNYTYDNEEEMTRLESLRAKVGNFDLALDHMFIFISQAYKGLNPNPDLRPASRVLKFLEENPSVDPNIKELMQVFGGLKKVPNSIERNDMIDNLRLQTTIRLYKNGIAKPAEKQSEEDVLVTLIKTAAEFAKTGVQPADDFQKGIEDVSGVYFYIRQEDRNGLCEYNNESEFKMLTERMEAFNKISNQLLTIVYDDHYNPGETDAEKKRRLYKKELISKLAACTNRMFDFIAKRKEMSSKTHESSGVKKVTPQTTAQNPQ